MSTSVGTTQEQLGHLFDAVAAADQVIAQAFAVRAAAVDEARRFSEAHAGEIPLGPNSRWDRDEIARRELSSELAATLRLPEPTALNLLAESRALAEELPATRAALQAGLISYRHAQTLVGQAWSIPAEGLPAFEAALLPAAQTLTVAKLKQKARVLRERLHPETITTRRARSILDRTSWVQAEPDGMATLHLTPGVGQGVGATVQVTVSVLTLLGHSEEPGYLEGYGPISSETARDLAFRRVQKICARRRPRSHPRLAPSRPNRRRQPHSPL